MPVLIAVIFGAAVVAAIAAPLWFNRDMAKALKRGPPKAKVKTAIPGVDLWKDDELKTYLLEQGKRLEPDRKGIAT